MFLSIIFLTLFKTHIVEEYKSTSILIKDAITLGLEKKLGKVFLNSPLMNFPPLISGILLEFE